MKKMVRILGLCSILATTALSATYAEPPVQNCGCGYCSRTAPTRECINFDGSTITCGYFLAVTLCQG